MLKMDARHQMNVLGKLTISTVTCVHFIVQDFAHMMKYCARDTLMIPWDAKDNQHATTEQLRSMEVFVQIVQNVQYIAMELK